MLRALFQRYKTALICNLPSFCVAMALRRRPLALTQPPEEPTGKVPELFPSTYVETVSPAFDPTRVLLCRVVLNGNNSKYVFIGFYPTQNYQPLVEFGDAKLLPMILTVNYVPMMVERLPILVEAMCQYELYQCKSEDKGSRMNTTGSLRVANVILDKH